jgi:predicted transcriptional regulator
MKVMDFLTALPLDGEGCVAWPYGTNGVGYGQVNMGKGKKVLAHRVACERKNGPPPTEKHHAAHDCGNGHLGCVAPWHLSWKTPKENAADIDRHGRRLRGMEVPGAKVTPEHRAAILANAGKISHAAIAQSIGVSQTIVSRIIRKNNHRGASRLLPKSGCIGIRIANGKFLARFSRNGVSHTVGTFRSLEEAKTARDQAVLNWIAQQIEVTPEQLKGNAA